MADSQGTLRQRYLAALDSLVAKVRQDSYIIAAILCGSLAYDTVWEKSDIDLVLVGRDGSLDEAKPLRRPFRTFGLVEDGINIHATLYSRGSFKRALEQALQSSFFSSYIAKSTLLFSLDPTIEEYYAGGRRLGAADRERGLLLAALDVLPTLAKAEKWLVVKDDPAYCFQWLTYVVGGIARMEIITAGEIPGRELVQQAMPLNPELFRALYFDLLERPTDRAALRAALDRVVAYLDERTPAIFRPILAYLAEAGGPRSMSEINAHFSTRMQSEGVGYVCEWLAQRGVVGQIATPLRLTERSRATVDEAAYFYDGAA
jgi:uncharacterized protein